MDLDAHNALMRMILESPKHVIVLAIDIDYRYVFFTHSHAETMKTLWGVDIAEGMVILDLIGDIDDRMKAKANFDRALQGEYLVLQEEYGDQNLKRTTYEDRYAPIRDDRGNIIGVSVFVTDITEQIIIESRLREMEVVKRVGEERSMILNSIGEGVYGVLLDGSCFFVNPAALSILGYTYEEMVGMNTHQLIHHHHPDGTLFPSDECIIHRAYEAGAQCAQRDWLFRKEGTIFPVEIIATPIYNGGIQYGTVIAFNDITRQYAMEQELIEANRRLRHQAITDPLTELYNRRFFEEQGKTVFESYRKGAKSLAVIAMDIDFFKQVNDSYGHEAGDQVLVEVSALIRKQLRSEDILARVGGEEFTLLLPDVSLSEALEVAERIRDHLHDTHITVGETNLCVRMSFGVAAQDERYQSFAELVSMADHYLYEAKNGGRDRIVSI